MYSYLKKLASRVTTILLLSTTSLYAQDLTPENFFAIQSSADGDVLLTWSPGSGDVDCTEYLIFYENVVTGWDNELQISCAHTSHVVTGLDEGLWEFSMATRYYEEVCDINPDDGGLECESNEEQSPITDTILINIGDDVGQPTPGPLPELFIDPTTPNPSANVSHDSWVGATQGTFSVTPTGAASYHIPIHVPRGTAGLTPSLSLSYNSSSGNGVVGKGWRIGGLGSITRCGQRLLHDNNVTPIQWNSQDRFCMNGARLLLKSGTYGAPNAEYTTDIETHSVIKAFGGTTGHPDYFEVTARDGRKTYYGKDSGTQNSRMAMDGLSTRIYRWHKSHEHDLAHNAITYHYDSAGLTLSEVRYAYGATSSYGYRVTLSYDHTREDTQTRVIGGYPLTQTDRLTTIGVYNAAGSRFRSYTLTYRDLDDHADLYSRMSKLESIRECGTSSCFDPTVFTWTEDDLDPNDMDISTLIGGIYGTWVRRWGVGDMNGDGFQDLYIDVEHGRSPYGNAESNCQRFIRRYYGSADGLSLDSQQAEACYSGSGGLKGRHLLDYNHDGRYDDDESASLYGRYYVDLNGDGLTDKIEAESVLVGRNTLYVHLAYQNPSSDSDSSAIVYHSPYGVDLPTTGDIRQYDLSQQDVKWGDFNGDGKPDMIIAEYEDRYSNAKKLLPNESVMFDIPLNTHGETHMTATIMEYMYDILATDLVIGDINGDGVSDIVNTDPQINDEGELDDLNISYRITGFQESFSQSMGMPPGSVSLVDIDLDGFLDLVSTDVLLWRGVEEGYTQGPDNFQPGGGDPHLKILGADFNGDGLAEYVVAERGGISLDSGLPEQFYELKLAQYPRKNGLHSRIARITTAMGHSTDITYANIAESDHYKPVAVNASGPSAIRDTLCIDSFNSGCRVRYDGAITSESAYHARLNNGPLLPESTSETLGEAFRLKPVNGGIAIVTDVTTDNPHTGSSSPGNVNATGKKTQQYYYARAFTYGARGFVGFETIAEVDHSVGLETQTVFRQDYPFNGRPYLHQVRTTGGRILSTTYTDWQLNRDDDGNVYFPYFAFPRSAETASHDLDNGALLKTQLDEIFHSDMSREGFPHETRVTAIGANGEELRQSTYREYTSASACGAIGLVRYQEVSARRTVPGQATSTKSHTTGYGYRSADSNAGFCGQRYREVIDHYDEAYEVITDTTYDSLGNPETITLAVQNNSEPPRSTRFEYDPLGRLAIREYDSNNRLTETISAYDDWGMPTQISSVNGLRTDIYYDSFRREFYRHSNDGSWTRSGMHWCGVVPCPSGAKTRTELRHAGGGFHYTYADVLGRPLRTTHSGFDGRLVYSDTEYTASGQVRHQSEPYYAGDATYWRRFDYDALQRLTTTRHPDGSETHTDYLGLAIQRTNALSQTRWETFNALGELSAVEDHDGGRVTNEYDAHGNLTKATTHPTESHLSPVVVTMGYDTLGRKLWMDDPDKGYWTYHYNHYGDLVLQTDANGATQSLLYDNNGRLHNRTDRLANGSVDHHTRWFYDGTVPLGAGVSSVANAVGQISAVVHSTSSGVERCDVSQSRVCEIYSYDAFGRSDGMTKRLGAAGNEGEYHSGIHYDASGRILEEYDVVMGVVRDSGVRYHYNAYGYNFGLSDRGTGGIDGDNGNHGYEGLYEIRAMNARGQVTEAIRGNGVTSHYTYNPANGRIEKQTADIAALFPVQYLEYDWDAIGNLTTRRNYSGRSTQFTDANAVDETFCYDNLNRIIYVHNNTTNGNCSISTAEQHQQYDSLGNITYKQGLGNYSYGKNGAGPHAVTEAGSRDYYYDANGNMTSDSLGRSVKYTPFDKPYEITQSGGHKTTIYYGPHRERWKRVDERDDGVDVTTLYLGSVERITYSNTSRVTWKRYLGDYAIYTIETDANDTVTDIERLHIYTDYQGSTDVITDAWGSVVATLGFDVWGERRDAYHGGALSGAQLYTVIHQTELAVLRMQDLTTKGYTGHEHLDEVGLIHMNGRVYDPTLARFMSADILVPDPLDTQSYNRYSYVRNRPMFYTDPSGFSECKDNDEMTATCSDSNAEKAEAQAEEEVVVTATAPSSGNSSGGMDFSSYVDSVGGLAANSEAGGSESQNALSQSLKDQATASLGYNVTNNFVAANHVMSLMSAAHAVNNYLRALYTGIGVSRATRKFLARFGSGSPSMMEAMALGGFNNGLIAKQLYPGDIEKQKAYTLELTMAYAEGYMAVFGLSALATKAAGSGPAKGFLEVSSNFKSSKAVQSLTNSNPIDFIFDPKSQRFIMGRNSLGHDGIRMAGNIGHRNIVGGSIWRQNGKLMTDQSSGHYGTNWTAAIRKEFIRFMSKHDVDVNHSATYRK